MSPLNNILIKNIQTKYLIRKQNTPREIIFALPTNIENKITANYIKQQLKEKFDTNIKFSHLAQNISRKINMKYTDPNTLTATFNNRN